MIAPKASPSDRAFQPTAASAGWILELPNQPSCKCVEAWNRLLNSCRIHHFVFGDTGNQLLCDFLCGLGPDINDLIISFTVSYQTLLILVVNLRHFVRCFGEETRLCRAE